MNKKSSPSLWYIEPFSDKESNMHRIKDIILTKQTKFQNLQIIETAAYGKSLILDNKIQSSIMDEFIYHEAIVHPAMISHPNPSSVFIAGGGEGATLREVLKYDIVKEVTMVDIDADVVTLAKEYLEEWHRGAFEDKRVKLEFSDARSFLKNKENEFDVMILDLSEPLEDSPAKLLFTQQFYEKVAKALKKDGLLSLQAGTTNIISSNLFCAVYSTLRDIFEVLAPYEVFVPSYATCWGFIVASFSINPADIPPKEIDDRLKERGISGLRFYDGITHQSIFSLSKYLREALMKSTFKISDSQVLVVD
jgi:spermidine synthase